MCDCGCSQPSDLEQRVETLELQEDVRNLTERYSFSSNESRYLEMVKDPLLRHSVAFGMSVAYRRGFDEGSEPTNFLLPSTNDSEKKSDPGWIFFGAMVIGFIVPTLIYLFFG